MKAWSWEHWNNVIQTKAAVNNDVKVKSKELECFPYRTKERK